MNYSHHESEKFRAETFRFLGYACCTPFGLSVLNLLMNGKLNCHSGFILSFFLLLLGLDLVFKSYDIMINKEIIYDKPR